MMTDRDEKGYTYTVIVPDLPGCKSQGSSVDEALNNIRVTIAEHFATLSRMGQELPGDPRDVLEVAII